MIYSYQCKYFENKNIRHIKTTKINITKEGNISKRETKSVETY